MIHMRTDHPVTQMMRSTSVHSAIYIVVCGMVFPQTGKRTIHMRTDHPDDAQYQCTFCHKAYHVKEAMHDHRRDCPQNPEIINGTSCRHKSLFSSTYPCYGKKSSICTFHKQYLLLRFIHNIYQGCWMASHYE